MKLLSESGAPTKGQESTFLFTRRIIRVFGTGVISVITPS
jgi:hypothetical protein